MDAYNKRFDKSWFDGVDRQLKGIHEEPLSAFELIFGELSRYRPGLDGNHRRAADSLWAATVAYLTQDVGRGDELRLQAARCLRNPDWHLAAGATLALTLRDED